MVGTRSPPLPEGFGRPVLLLNGFVGIAVTGGFAMLFLEFMEETRRPKSEDER